MSIIIKSKKEETKEKKDSDMTSISVSNKLWKTINDNRINSKETKEEVLWRWYNLLRELKGDDS